MASRTGPNAEQVSAELSAPSLPSGTATADDSNIISLQGTASRHVAVLVKTLELGSADSLTIKAQVSDDKSQWYYVTNPNDADSANPADWSLLLSADINTGSPSQVGKAYWISAFDADGPFPIPLPYFKLEFTPNGGSPGSDATMTYSILHV